MSVNLPSLYAQQFATNVQMLVQQRGSRLRDKVMSQTHVGEQASPLDQIGAISMQEVTGRFAAMGRVDAAVDRRWVFPTSFDLPQLVDKFDELKLLSDPKSKYVENAVAAASRQLDDLIIDAFFGTAYTGKAGTTSTVYNTAYRVAADFAASAENGLTVAKLREAKRLLMANEVDIYNDQLFCAATATQLDNLLGEIQVVSKDYNDKAVLVDGRLERFLGINFIHTERLDLVSTDNRQIPVWAKSGMHLGIWGDIRTSISQRNDLQGEPWQAYIYMTAGATRLEEKKVIQILCDE